MKPRHKFYSELRQKIGTRLEVSKLLGIHKRTLERRENGQIKISEEMVAALCLFWNRKNGGSPNLSGMEITPKYHAWIQKTFYPNK